MGTIYLSHLIENANTIEKVVEIVNKGTCEGVECIDFSSDMLAGCHIYSAALDDEYGDMSNEYLEVQAEFLADAGAEFNMAAAIKYAQYLHLAA